MVTGGIFLVTYRFLSSAAGLYVERVVSGEVLSVCVIGYSLFDWLVGGGWSDASGTALLFWQIGRVSWLAPFPEAC